MQKNRKHIKSMVTKIFFLSTVAQLYADTSKEQLTKDLSFKERKYRGDYDLSKGGSGLIEEVGVVDPVCDHMNISEFRAMFPICNALVHNQPLVFLDSGATAQMPQPVLDAIVAYYMEYKSNVGRGLYAFAEQSTKAYERSRCKIARFINAQAKEVVFTSGATAGINLVAHMWAEHNLKEGDEIIISEVEHNANFIPWQQLAKRKGLILKRAPINERGVVDPKTMALYVTAKTKLVAITHTSNILGTTNDIQGIVEIAHAVGAKVLVDAAQSIAHQKIDVKSMDCDFLVFSAHKLFGPTGVGALFVKETLFDECTLHNFGGGSVYDVFVHDTDFKEWPHGAEPGTGPIAQVIGLGAAVDFVQKYINFEEVQKYETALVRKLAHALKGIEGIKIISFVPEEGEHNNMVTFVIEGHDAYDVAAYLDTYGIALRAGFHCVQPYHDQLGGAFSLRASFTAYNTEEEVDLLIHCLKKLLNK